MSGRSIVRYIVLLTMVLTFAGCATQSPQLNTEFSTIPAAPEDNSPRIVLSATPQQGFAPMTVTIHARIEGIPQSNVDCMAQIWVFGDGSLSAEKPNCPDPTGTGTTREFFVEHTFEQTGTYDVRLVLGDKEILSKPLGISVIANRAGY